MSKADVLSLIFNDSQKKEGEEYRLTENDILLICSYIAQDQGKFNSAKKMKCAEFLTTNLPLCSHLLPNISQQITEKFNIILSTDQTYLKDYFLRCLLTLFFKVNTCKELFFDIYFNTIKSFNFQIDDIKLKEYKTSFYYQAFPFKNFNKILYIYNKIDDKHLMQERILIILTKLENEYKFELLHFIFAIMCYKIKANPTKFYIEKERTFFRLLYQEVLTPFTSIEPLFNLISYAFNTSVPMQNRKIFLFVLLILFTSIGHKRFNELLLLLYNNLNTSLEYIDKLDLNIMKENVSYLYELLDASKTYQHCFECVIKFLTTCEEPSIISKHSNHQQTHSKSETMLLSVKENLNIMKNLIILFEAIVKEKKNFIPVYMKIQLLIIEFVEPYREKNKMKINQLFLSASSNIMKLSELTFDKTNTYISSFLDFINKNIYGCSILYYNWYVLIFSKFSLFDSYKIILNFLLMNLQNEQPKLLNFVVKLPNELRKVNKYAWQTILDHFILDDSFNELTETQKVNVIRNLKNIFYYELTNTGNAPNTLLNQHNEIIIFFKEKFDIFSSLFFQRSITYSDNNCNNNSNIQIDIEDMFDNYMNNINNFHMNVNSNNIQQRNINSINTNDTYEIQIEILSTFALILNSLTHKDNIPHYYLKFTLDLIDQIILFASNYAKSVTIDECNNPLIQYIQNVISFIINLYIKLIQNGEQFVSHPIKVLFNGIIRHLLIKILKYSNDDNAENYYQYYLSILNTLQQYNVDFKDISNNIIYMIKQMIYKNVDSQNFRNPLLIKAMKGLTDIDDTLLNNKYIIDLLNVLSKEDHLNMYGFYLRYLKLSEDCKDNCDNVRKLIALLIELNWIDSDYSDLSDIIKKQGNQHVVRFLYEYLYDRKHQNDFNLVKSIYDKKYKYLILTYIDDL